MSALQVRLDTSALDSALAELSHSALQILEAPLQAIGGSLRLAQIKDHGGSTSGQAGAQMIKASDEANKQFAATVDKDRTQ